MIERKVYPYGEDFQDAVITLILRDPAFLSNHLEVIDPAYFDSEHCATLCRLIKGFFEEHHVIPNKEMVTVLVTDYVSKLKIDSANREVLLAIVDAIYRADTSLMGQIAEKVVHFGQSRIMETMVLQLSNMIASAEIPERMWELIDKTRSLGHTSSDGINLREALPNAPEILMASSLYNADLKVKTGIGSLDLTFNGGVGRKEVALLLGQASGIGKSLMLTNFGANAFYQNLSVGHLLCNELDEDDVIARYAARLSGFPIQDIANGRAGEAYKRKMANIFNTIQVPIWATTIRAGTTMSAVRSYLSRLKYKYNLDLGMLIIDNIDDMSSGQRYGREGPNTYHDQGGIYVQLKDVAKDFNVAVWTDSQAQRGASKSEFAGQDDIADSIKKIRKADLVISVNQKPEEYAQKIMRIYTIKARRNARIVSKITCAVDAARMIMQEVVQQ
jgi:replicative DNA helicase